MPGPRKAEDRGRRIEREAHEIINGALADLEDDIAPEDLLDLVTGQMEPLSESEVETIRLIIARYI